ncbi:MAG: response regulator [Alphaproteobacteria bacterium]|jgi:two-component system chemotaxis response regulator CheY|nr:response regulator [Alphaproteobacteria bacterium]
MTNPIVMTVDDSRTILMLLDRTLRQRGFDVVQAEDGVAALERLETERPHVLITDINMPRLDGFGLIEQVRAQDHFRALPILVLTTEATPEKRARARAGGATGWIVKPFEADKLEAAIRRVIA